MCPNDCWNLIKEEILTNLQAITCVHAHRMCHAGYVEIQCFTTLHQQVRIHGMMPQNSMVACSIKVTMLVELS